MFDNLKGVILWATHKVISTSISCSQNFRPVSNLTYLGKLAEHFVCKQLTRYAELTGMMEPYQSAYRQNFSTETALLWVKTDILDAMDRKEVTCLVMLDLSDAFDSISHKLLLNHLNYHFGIIDTVFQVDLQLLNQQITMSNSMWWAGKCGWVEAESLWNRASHKAAHLDPILFNFIHVSTGETFVKPMEYCLQAMGTISKINMRFQTSHQCH